MSEAERSALVERERRFHDDRFQGDRRASTAKYYAVDEGRAAYAALVEAATGPGTEVLEYGCGPGSLGPDLVMAGSVLIAIDISQVAIDQAEAALAAQLGAAAGTDGVGRARHLVMDAHALELEADSCDVVCGSGILHHLELDVAFGEVARVLRAGGVGIFYEPLGTNPLINLYRWATPKLRTPDEHPLVAADLDLARRWFGEVEWEVHTFLALAGAVLGRLGPARRAVGALARADRWLFRRVPWTRRFAWVVVVQLRAPHPPLGDRTDRQPPGP